MRILCLNFHRPMSASWAELFLSFSPRLVFIEPHLVFLDITSTAHLFKSEEKLLEQAQKKACEFDPEVRSAISDTPYGAEVFSVYANGKIISPLRESAELENLPLDALRFLKGLVPWSHPQRLEACIDFLKALRIEKLRGLSPIPVDSLHQRWGELGTAIFRRLHGTEKQEVSFFHPTEPLSAYTYFDEPAGHVDGLFFEIEKSLRFLFERLFVRQRFLSSLQICLRCEYSETQHVLKIQPSQPGRDFDLVLKLINMRLMDVSLDNPVREYDIDVFDTSEKVVQLDLFCPRDDSADRLNRLQSLFSQADLDCGFLRTVPGILPERSFTLLKHSQHLPEEFLDATNQVESLETADDGSLRKRPEYARMALKQSPRPSIILEKPCPLSVGQVKSLKFLTRFAIERIEDNWWCDHQERDYFIAHDQAGAWVWIFQDLINQNYYLHGYFD